MIVGLDLGNGNIKGIGNGKQFFIPSTLIEGVSKLDDNSINVEYDGKSYILGKMQGARKRDYSKYNTEHHKIMLLAALAAMAPSKECEITPVLGLPIKYFLNHGTKYKHIVANFTKEDSVEIKINGVLKKIKIKDCLALPQGAIPFIDPEADGYTLVIDIGSGTVDVSYWEGKSLVKAESYNIGCQDLYTDVANAINNLNTDYNIEPFLIERQLVRNPNLEYINILGGREDVKNIVATAKKAFTNKILSKISQDFSNLTIIDKLVVAGGGSLYVEKDIRDTYEYADINNDVFFNAKIFYGIGVTTFGNNKN